MWAQAFNCPVYISVEDEIWLCRQPPRENGVLRFLTGNVGVSKEIVKGVTVVKLGGHFPGSLVLHWGNKLFIADTFFTVLVSLRFLPSSFLSVNTSRFSFSAICSPSSVMFLNYTSRELASAKSPATQIVCILPASSAPRSNHLCFSVVYSQYDPFTTLGHPGNVGSGQAIRVRHHARRVCRNGCSRCTA